MAQRPRFTPRNLTPAAVHAAADAEFEAEPNADDAALGIGDGEEEMAPAFAPAAVAEAAAGSSLDIAALMANPDFLKLVDTIVASRIGATAPPVVAAAQAGGPDWQQFMEKLDRAFNAMSEQKPGYIKPWSADERAARDAGLRDLKAILADYRAKGVWPTYLLGEDFYGQSQNGLKIHKAGKKIKTLVFPAESFQPLDEPAARVYEAYKRWVGDVHEIGDLIATAMANARGQDAPTAPELTGGKPLAAQSDVIEMEDEAVDVGPSRQMGTLVPEPRPIGRPGTTGAPVGPEFTEYV
jgi:hypothetical protein